VTVHYKYDHFNAINKSLTESGKTIVVQEEHQSEQLSLSVIVTGAAIIQCDRCQGWG